MDLISVIFSCLSDVGTFLGGVIALLIYLQKKIQGWDTLSPRNDCSF
jgi:hypothetical protein